MKMSGRATRGHMSRPGRNKIRTLLLTARAPFRPDALNEESAPDEQQRCDTQRPHPGNEKLPVRRICPRNRVGIAAGVRYAGKTCGLRGHKLALWRTIEHPNNEEARYHVGVERGR